MSTSHFSIRLDDATIESLDAIAAECKVKRSNVIDWALEGYKDLFQANGGRMLTNTDMLSVLQHIRERAKLANTPFQALRAAEDPPEVGKIIDPAAGGGKKTARTPAIYPSDTKRASSH